MSIHMNNHDDNRHALITCQKYRGGSWNVQRVSMETDSPEPQPENFKYSSKTNMLFDLVNKS